jgi:hypothetical protein
VLCGTDGMLQGLKVVHSRLICFCFNVFVSSRGDDEEEDFFVDDQDINKLIIVTQV